MKRNGLSANLRARVFPKSTAEQAIAREASKRQQERERLALALGIREKHARLHKEHEELQRRAGIPEELIQEKWV